MLKNLGETLERALAADPDATAYSFLPDGEERAGGFTFVELDRRARALAGQLHESGLTGSRVLLVHPPGPDFVVALFACFYAGVTAVPVVPPESRYRAARARVEAITAACAPAAQLTSSAGGPALEPERLPVLETDRAPADDQGFTPPDVGPESTAILQFTSGATRAPRGVVLSHRSVLANLDLMDERYERRRGVVTVNWLPLHHDMGLFGALLRSVFMVGHCVLMPPGAMLRKPIRWWRAVVDYDATVTGGPDFGFDLSVRRTTAEERDALDLSRLSVVYTGAEPVRAATLDRFAAAFAGAGFDRRVFLPVYGLAEATLMVTGAHVPDPPRVLTVSATGWPPARSPPRPPATGPSGWSPAARPARRPRCAWSTRTPGSRSGPAGSASCGCAGTASATATGASRSWTARSSAAGWPAARRARAGCVRATWAAWSTASWWSPAGARR